MAAHNQSWLLQAAILSHILAICLSDVTVSLDFKTYRNSASRDSLGRLCDDIWRSECDHVFEICVDSLHGDISTRNRFQMCAYGQAKTGEFKDTDSIVFDHDMHSVQNPLTVTIPNSEKGILLKVRVWDDDTSKGKNDHVDDLHFQYVIGDDLVKNIALTSGNIHKQVIVGSRSIEPTSLTVDFSAYCSANYYMTNGQCDKYCEPRDDNLGHYTCTADGDIECRQGWLDEQTNCTTAEVNCLTHSCKHGGTCTGGRTAFSCNCTTGFTGVDCSEDIDECKQGVGKFGLCMESNTLRCDNTKGSYICVCKPGYTKDFCQHSVPSNDFRPGLAPITDTRHNGGMNQALVIGLIVGILVLIIVIVFITACFLRERRKRHMKDQGTGTMLATSTNGQQTTVALATTDNRATNTYLDTAHLQNYENTHHQRAARAQPQGRSTHGMKAMEAGLMAIPPPYKERLVEGQLSPGFDNHAYGMSGGGATNAHIYEEPRAVKLDKKY